MDILIKDMKIPKGCYYRYEYCPFFMTDITGGKAFCSRTGKRANYSCRPKTCPLVHIPTHGPLIDAKELSLKIISKNFETCEEKLDWVLNCIRNAPVVLEASNGKV